MSYTPPVFNAVAFIAGPASTPPAWNAVALKDTQAAFVFAFADAMTWAGNSILASLIMASVPVAAGALTWTGTASTAGSATQAYLTPDPLTWQSGNAKPQRLEAWNPSDHYSNLVLSAGHRTVTVDAGAGTAWGLIRATVGRSVGKYYFEVQLNDDEEVAVGLATALEPLSGALGMGSGGWAFLPHAAPAEPEFAHAGTVTTHGGVFYPTQVLSVAVDFAAGALWFGVSGYWWSGDPALGTDPHFTGLSGTLYPAASLRYTGIARSLTARFFPSQLEFVPPTGFSAWGDDLLSIPIRRGAMTWTGERAHTQVESIVGNAALVWDGTAGIGTAQPYPVLWRTPGSRTLNTTGMYALVSATFLATHYKISGKGYFEVLLRDLLPNDDVAIGVIAFGGSISGMVGQHATGWGFSPSRTAPYPSELRHASEVVSYGGLFAVGDTVNVAVDLDAGRLWFGRNGVWIGGDPAANTAPAFSGLPAALYPAVSIRPLSVAASRDVLDGAFSVRHLQSDPPAGFTRWQPSDRVTADADGMIWTEREVFIAGEAVSAGSLIWAGSTAAPVAVSAVQVAAGALTLAPRPVAALNGAFWNPFDRAPGIDFYLPIPGQPQRYTYVTTNSGDWQSARATVGRSSGRWFWRVAVWGNDGGKQEIKVGLVDALADLTAGNLGDRTTEWMLELGGNASMQNITWFRNGALPPYPGYHSPWPGYEYHHQPVFPTHTFSSTPNGSVLLIAVDLNVGKMWVGCTYWDNTTEVSSQLIISGLTLVASNLTGTVYPCVSLRQQFSAPVIAHGEFCGPVRYAAAAVDPDGMIAFEVVPEGFNCFAGWASAESAWFSLTAQPVAYTGGTASMGASVALTLPALTLTAHGGAAAALTLPALRLTAAATAVFGAGALRLPALTLTACGGAAAALPLPALRLTATTTQPGFAAARMALPALTLTARGNTGSVAQGALELPAPILTAGGGGRARLTLPALRMAAGATGMGLATVALELPRLRLSATGTVQAVARVALTLPVLELRAGGPHSALLRLPALTLAATARTAYDPAATSTGYVINLATRAVTQWTPCPFSTLVAAHGALYGLFNGTLYRIEGDQDAGAPIAATLRLAPQAFGSFYRRRLDEVWLYGRIVDGVALTLIPDEEQEWKYQTDGDAQTAMGSHRVGLGKGVTFHTVGLTLRNRNGGRFDVAGLKFEVEALSRRSK